MGKFSGSDAATTPAVDESMNGNGAKPAAKKSNDLFDIVGRVIDVVVNVVGVIAYVPARILDNFVDQNKPGIRILAGGLFMAGIAMSSDSFFQAFGGKPLFPFWEDSWIGIGWFWIWTKVNFWAAVVVALAVMWIESQAIRGKKPDQAKADYEAVKHHTVPEESKGKIDLVNARRQDYKRAGMGERSILGLFILIVFVADVVATFSSRPIWGQPPLALTMILLYNLVSIVAGESGYVMWCQANRK